MPKWIEKASKKVDISVYCPHDYFENGPNVDHNNVEFGETGGVIGCRGVACKECWDGESNEMS